MKIERIFPILVMCDVVLEVASVAGADAAPARGPLLSALWLAVIGITLVGWVGLFAMIREARPVYLASWLGYLALLALGGPVVSTAGGYALQMLMALVGGAVLAVAYLSELRTGFRPLLPIEPWLPPAAAETGGRDSE
jgi:hypothetical protein